MKKHKVQSTTNSSAAPLKYGLNIKKKTPNKASIWLDEAEENLIDLPNLAPALLGKHTNLHYLSHLKKSQTQLQEEPEDSSAYAYDEVYDAMKSKNILTKKNETDIQKAPKYILGLLESAKIRNMDLLRAKQKAIQREREAEDKVYEGKEQFVTSAYKEQLEQFKAMEEEEKKNTSTEQTSTSMASFYSNFLQESDDLRSAAINVSINPSKHSNNNESETGDTVITADEKLDQKEELAEQAEIARSHGETLLVNQDNQIVDKRQLLSSGLNISSRTEKSNTPKNYSKVGHDSRPSSSYSSHKVYQHSSKASRPSYSNSFESDFILERK